jgi:cysteine-rich secretory family protein
VTCARRPASVGCAALLLGAILPLAIPARAASPPPPWLARINMYRAMDQLPPIANDRALTTGDQNHAVYLIKNFAQRLRDGSATPADINSESSSTPLFTKAGRDAAPHSETDFVFGEHQSPEDAIDLWMQGPHHRMLLLNPALIRIGYGFYCENGLCAQTVDVVDGIDSKPIAPDNQYAIEFPPADSTLSLNDLPHEMPDPLSACPGYAYPAGLPITFEIGFSARAKLSAYSIVKSDEPGAPPIEACGYDAYSYRNESRAQTGRIVGDLRSFGAIVVIPRRPLDPGNYRARVTVNDKQFSWMFAIAPNDSVSTAR